MDSKLQRREFLRAGLAAFGSLSLSGLFRLRAEAPAVSREPTAVIVVWLRGGSSHLETYDPKPDAPAEYRGPFGPKGAHIYRVLVQKKPRPVYIEVREDQLEVLDEA